MLKHKRFYRLHEQYRVLTSKDSIASFQEVNKVVKRLAGLAAPGLSPSSRVSQAYIRATLNVLQNHSQSKQLKSKAFCYLVKTQVGNAS